jgi:GNAT superfamily N-acetyltransferase
MSKQLHIRPFTAVDYEVWCAVHNAVYPEYPETPDEVRFHDERREAHVRWGRFLAEEGGQVVGTASYGQRSGAYHPRRFLVEVQVPPAFEGRGIGAGLYDHLLAHLGQYDPIALRSEVREDCARGLRFAAARGFVEDMREQESRLDLAGFDPARFSADVRRAEDQGIAIKSVRELSETDPDYRTKMYDMSWAISQDIPHTDQLTRQPFAVWAQRFDNPNFLPDGNLIALDGDHYVGISTLWAAGGTADLYTGTTGVLREYRKHGLATALKVRALAWAKESGAPYVRTWNEVNNDGMLNINFRLGFVRLPQWVEIVCEIKKDETA